MKIRNFIRRCAAALVSLAFLITYPVTALGENPGVSALRIGLYYGVNALPGANLQNETGAGYLFGYYDANRVFVTLDQTSETKISAVKNKNVFWDGANYTDAEGGVCAGAYHIDAGAYPDYPSAKFAAEQLRAGGVSAFVSYTLGGFRVRAGSFRSKEAAAGSAYAGLGTPATGSAYCVSVVVSGTDNVIFQYDAGDNRGLGILPAGAERPITWFKGYKYAGGFEYRRMDGNNLTVSSVVSPDDYVKGVIPYEINVSWPEEALKTAALCAKSYSYSYLNKHAASGFDLCNGIDCQVYHGVNAASAASDAAADAVTGLYILYGGKPIEAVYMSSDGGSTENAENVWTDPKPYLVAVADPYEDLSTSTYGRWSFVINNAQLTDILNSKGYANAGIVNVTCVYTAAGNVYSITMTDKSGKAFTFSKERARTILNGTWGTYTYSQRFTVSGGTALCVLGADGKVTTLTDLSAVFAAGAGGVTGGVSVTSAVIGSGGVVSSVPQTAGDSYVINGTGWGHNVGLSQNGAKAMSLAGWSYEQIIKFYYTGVTIGVLQ